MPVTKLNKIICMILIISLLLMSTVSAVGIKWFTEQEYVSENSEKCITYGSYNPSGKDIKVKIEVEGKVTEIIDSESSEDKIIKANTRSKNAEMINFCFDVPKIYKEDCLFFKFICKQDCEEEQTVYDGEVIMTEKPMDGSSSSMAGSGTTIAASAPLSLIVKCEEYDRNWTLVYVILILIVLVTMIILIYRKYRQPKLQRELSKLKELQEKIKKEKKRTEK